MKVDKHTLRLPFCLHVSLYGGLQQETRDRSHGQPTSISSDNINTNRHHHHHLRQGAATEITLVYITKHTALLILFQCK